jgi:hypothetical protein
MKHGTQLAITCLLLLAFALRLNGQVFMRPFDQASLLAMGGAGIALPDLGAGLSNDAQLGMAPKMAAWAGAALPFGLRDWQSAHFQGMARLGKHSGAGMDIRHAGTDDYSEQQLRLMYGRRLAANVYLGGSGELLRVAAPEYGQAAGFGFSLSVLARALPTLWFGAQVQNPFQQKIGDFSTQSRLRVGGTWQPSRLFLLSLETEKNTERPVQIKMGMAYQPSERIVLRLGVRSGAVARAGFGMGFRLKNGLSAEAASEWHPALGITPAAMFVWQKN